MLNVRPWLRLVVAGALSASAVCVSAAGFGAGGSGAVLGQRLAFSVSFRLDAGDTLSLGCVKAEVQFGDRRLPASQVTTALDMQAPDVARIRVQTDKVVDEPVVDVVLNAGCTAPQTRRFVIFADPPRASPATAILAATALAAMSPVDVAQLDGANARAAATAVQGGGSGGSNGGNAAGGSPAGASGSLGNAANARSAEGLGRRPAALQSEASPSRSRSAVRRAQARRRVEPAERQRNAASARPARTAATTTVAAVAAAPRATLAPTPRLELEFAEPARAEPDAIDAALAAVSAAASATQTAQAAASAASVRIAALERDVERLRGEARNSQNTAGQWQSRLDRAEQTSRWLWPLLILTLTLAALVAWLSWRLAGAERRRQAPWREAAVELAPAADRKGADAPQPTPFITSAARRGALDFGRPRGTPAWPPPAPAESLPAPEERDTVSLRAAGPASAPSVFVPDADDEAERQPVLAIERTLPYPANATAARADGSQPRDVSIEELIDLEQQAEFFVVLGQDEAAIDLLVDHLRNTGGGSPLPYLKLLEIYHRRGDRDEYERTRMRFNHRFNAYAPDWDLGLHSGRSLEDYTGVVPRLQQVWSRPLDAMAELEALLFRKSRGELFDLPAYREVLFLYSLARDLLDRESAESGDVDLLLPMADGTEFGSTAPTPFLALESLDEVERAGPQTLPMAPLDVDLSGEPARQTSIFDALHEAPAKPG